MKIQKKVIVIVGAYSTGRYLAPGFTGYGYPCIHVQPGEKIDPYMNTSYCSSDFIQNIVWQDDDSVIKALQDYDIKAIIAGSEMGVLLADRLNEKLKMPTANQSALSQARRNKHLMQVALEKANIATVPHYKSSNLQQLLTWIDHSTYYPVVLKPLASAGTDGVTICQNETQAKTAFYQIQNTLTPFGEKNVEVLAQAYMKGTEFVVNTVSHASKHYVTDIIKVHKTLIDGSPIYDYAELLSPTENIDLYQKLSAYIYPVLDALGIKFGAGHSEIMLVNETTPFLIETAARPIGGIDPSAYTEALGYNQIAITVMAYVNPDHFYKSLIALTSLPLHKRLRCIFLISPVFGHIIKKPNPYFFTQLSSFHSLTLQEQGYLARTRTLLNCPGYINLLADSGEQLEKDYQEIRKHEKLFFNNLINDSCVTVPH